MASILFENFAIPAFYSMMGVSRGLCAAICASRAIGSRAQFPAPQPNPNTVLPWRSQAVAAMIGSARTYGVVLDSGHGITHAVPVYEGAALQHGIVSHQIAGQDIEGVLSQLIQNSGAATPPPSALREMKEKLCFVPLDYDKEIASSDSDPAQYTLPVSEHQPSEVASYLILIGFLLHRTTRPSP